MFEGLGDFYRQFKALAWKNSILKFRYCGTLLLEIAVPTVIIVLIGVLSKALPSVWNCDKPPENSYNCFRDFSSAFAALNQSNCQLRKIGVAPGSSTDTATATAAKDFVSWANNNTVFRSYDTFVYFSSESAFTDYITGSGYGIDPSLPIYSSAVILSGAYPSWAYSIRMNQTLVNVLYAYSCTN